MENWQSEFLQLLTFVVLTAVLIHRGSHESKDGDDEMRATLARVEHQVTELRGAIGAAAVGRPDPEAKQDAYSLPLRD